MLHASFRLGQSAYVLNEPSCASYSNSSHMKSPNSRLIVGDEEE